MESEIDLRRNSRLANADDYGRNDVFRVDELPSEHYLREVFVGARDDVARYATAHFLPTNQRIEPTDSDWSSLRNAAETYASHKARVTADTIKFRIESRNRGSIERAQRKARGEQHINVGLLIFAICVAFILFVWDLSSDSLTATSFLAGYFALGVIAVKSIFSLFFGLSAKDIDLDLNIDINL